jgi:cbb3-type cytochrome oxidase cytochrome c subunit
MKGLAPLVLGIFGTFAFSWVGLIVIPNWQIGHLNPQSDDEGTDIYPMPQSGMVERGARVYAANGCIYCHSQQVRADYAADDIERKWGDRRSAPRDYVFEQQVFLGKMRMGQDLANIGARAPKEEESPPPPPTAASPGANQSAPPTAASPAQGTPSPGPSASPAPIASPSAPSGSSSPFPGSPPPNAPASPTPKLPLVSPSPSVIANATSGGTTAAVSATPSLAPWPVRTEGEPPIYSAAWHHVHLYSPRSINIDSDMPSYRFLYRKRRISDARSVDALPLTGVDAPADGWEIVPTFDAECLVAYLMSLKQSHPLKEVRSAAPAAGGSPAASPVPAGQPAK